MPRLTEQIMQAFHQELLKEGGFAELVSKAAPKLKNVGSLGGAGLMLGSIGGAGLGAASGFHDARERGESVGGAALGGLAGGARGALRGAAAGGLAGGGLGAALKTDVSGLARGTGMVGMGSRFGQRQVHALTGMLSPQEL